MKFVVVDVETGGLKPNLHSILSLGAVVMSDDDVIGSNEWLIREDVIVANQEALDLNKIDIEEVKKSGQHPREVVEELDEWLSLLFEDDDRIVLAGWNPWFDYQFIDRLYQQAGMWERWRFSYHLFDVHSVARYWFLQRGLNMEHGNLDFAIEHFGVQLDGLQRHTALGDAAATAHVLRAMM